MRIRRSDIYAFLAWARTVGLGYVILTVGVAVAIGLVWQLAQENDRELERLARVEREQIELAEQRRQEIARTDYRVCAEVEAVKEQLREEAREDFQNLDVTLELLRIPRTPRVVAIARQNMQDELRRFAPVRCADLPSVRQFGLPPGLFDSD